MNCPRNELIFWFCHWSLASCVISRSQKWNSFVMAHSRLWVLTPAPAPQPCLRWFPASQGSGIPTDAVFHGFWISHQTWQQFHCGSLLVICQVSCTSESGTTSVRHCTCCLLKILCLVFGGKYSVVNEKILSLLLVAIKISITSRWNQ